MLSDLLNNGYYQYNEFLWIKDEWEDGGDIELLFTKDPNTLTYEDLGIDSISTYDFDIIGYLAYNNGLFCETKPIINGKYKFHRILIKKKSPLDLFINRLIYNHIKYQNYRMNKYPPQFGYSMNKNGSIKLDNPELECYMRLFYDNYHEFGYDRALNIFNKMNGIYKKLGSEPIPKAVMEKITDENFKKDLEDKK